MSDPIKSNSPEGAVVLPRFVRLARCSRATCKLIYPEDEMAQTPDSRRKNMTHGGCPKCKCRSFYPYNSDGTKASLGGEWKKSEWPIPSLPNIQEDRTRSGDDQA